MALSQKHRIALYEHFVPSVGEEVTEALLSEFPGRDGDELVTKDHLRAELAVTREDLRAELAVLRAEMHEGFSAMNRRLTTTVLAATGVSLAAYGAMTAAVITTLR